MKTERLFWTITLALILCAAIVSAQNEARPENRPRPGQHHRGGEFEPPPIERLMQNFKERNPEEYKRLETLRQENPDAFRNEIRTLLQTLRRQNFGRGRPPEHAGWHGHEPDPNRPGFRPNERGPRGPECAGGLHPPSQEMSILRQSIAKLVQSYRNTEDRKSRKQIRLKLKGELEKMYDLHEEDRLKMIALMEEKIEKMKQLMEERRSERDDIIQRQLKQITKKGDVKGKDRRRGKEE